MKLKKENVATNMANKKKKKKEGLILILVRIANIQQKERNYFELHVIE